MSDDPGAPVAGLDPEGPTPPGEAPPRVAELATARGETTIPASVVAKIARLAAAEVEGVELASASGLWGFLSRGRPGPGASADVASRRTHLDLRVAVTWPRPVGRVTEAVRRHVRSRVQELTGYEVTDVDIVVDALPVASGRTVGRVA